MSATAVRECVDCGYRLTEYYKPTDTRCFSCAWKIRGLVCCLCRTNKCHIASWYCKSCQTGIWRAREEIGQKRAKRIIQSAVKRGALPHPKTLTCVDCGNPARGYDHRNYSKPLEVEPVCARCNGRRGHAEDLALLIRKYCLGEGQAA